MNKGKIIAVEGGPRSGKTFLVHKLAERLHAHMHAELDITFPERLVEDMETNIRPFERILWFRNMLVSQYLDAIKRRDAGEIVVTDNFWIGYVLHIQALFEGKDDFEKSICEDVAKLDATMLLWPDKIIYLELSDELVKKFIKEGGREFDSDSEYFEKQILPIRRDIEKYYNEPKNQKNLIRVYREDLDFTKEKDLEKVVRLLNI